jgi:hypothetical protein
MPLSRTWLLAVVAALLATLGPAGRAEAEPVTPHINAVLPFGSTHETYQGGLSVVDQNNNPVAGTWTWSITSGSLPAGLLLDPASGQIQGLPLMDGRSDFTAQVADLTGNTLTASVWIVVQDPPPDPPPPPGQYDPVVLVQGVVKVAQCALTPGELQATLSTLLYGTPPQVC